MLEYDLHTLEMSKFTTISQLFKSLSPQQFPNLSYMIPISFSEAKFPTFLGFFSKISDLFPQSIAQNEKCFFVDSQPICTNWPNSQHIPSWEWAKSNSQLFPKLSTSVGTLSQETSQSMTDITCYDTDITVNGGYYILLIETSQRMEDITSHWWRYSIDWWTLHGIDGNIIVNGRHYMVLMDIFNGGLYPLLMETS